MKDSAAKHALRRINMIKGGSASNFTEILQQYIHSLPVSVNLKELLEAV